MIGDKRVASPSRSRYQYFPSHVTLTYNYFQMIAVSTLPKLYITVPNFPEWFQYFPTPSTKTFQIGSNTFQLLVVVVVPKLSRSVPLLSNSQYQNFPSIGRILILGSRLTWQSCSAHAHVWRCCLLSSPCFLTSPYIERAPWPPLNHVIWHHPYMGML